MKNWTAGQMNIFDFLDTVSSKEDQNKSAQDFLLESLKHGTGYKNGKLRIFNIVHNKDISEKEKLIKIKKEYGCGGSSSPFHKPYSLHGYDYNCNCNYEVRWYGKDKNEEFTHDFTWKNVFDAIRQLIASEEYIEQKI